MGTLNWAELVSAAGDVSTAGYEPLPDGDYDFVVVEGTAKETSTGKTMFVLKSQVEAGPHAKRLVWDNLVVSRDNSKALGIFFQKMASMGLTKEFFDRNPSNAQVEQALIGRRFRGRVTTEVYNEKARNRIDRYSPAAMTNVPPVAQQAPAPVASAPAFAPAPAPAPAPVPPMAAAAPASAPEVPF